MTDADLAKMPPKPLCPDVQVKEIDGALELVHSKAIWPFGCLLLLFVGFFVVVIVVASKDVPADVPIHPVQIFGGVAVAAMLVGMLLFALAAFFGLERVRLGPGGLEYERRALVLLRRLRFPLEEVNGVHEGITVSSENKEVGHFLTFETLGAPILFARGITEKERRWLIAMVNRHLDSLRPARALTEGDTPTDRNDTWRLQLSSEPYYPPGDSRAVLRRDSGDAEFAWAGQWELQEILVITFATLFVNGILGASLSSLAEHFSWLLFFFLFPFAVLGLIFLVACFCILTAPAWRLTWTFREHEIVKRMSGFGIGWSKRYTLASLDRIELRWQQNRDTGQLRIIPLLRPRAHYALSFVGTDGQEALRIDALTEGEARWMASIVFEMFPSWISAPAAVALESQGSARVIRPERCDVAVEELNGNLVLSYSRVNWGARCFLLVVLIGWSAVWAIAIRQCLFVTPYVVSWIALLVLTFRVFFTTERVRLGPVGLEYERRTVLTRHRYVPFPELKEVRAGTMPSEVVDDEASEDYYGPNLPSDNLRAALKIGRDNCVRFETLGEPVLFARGISSDEQRWLVAVLERCLVSLGEESSAPEGPTVTDGPWILSLSAVPVDPPSGSSVRLRLGPRSAEVWWPAQWSLSAIGGATLVNLFWNSIVGVFVLSLFFDFDPLLCIFLIPFELIGLFLFALWFVSLTAPAWRLTWLFREQEIVRRLSGFGIGRRRPFDLRARPGEPLLKHIELRRAEGDELPGHWFLKGIRPGITHAVYSLALIRPDGTTLLEIDALTQGEARWMANLLFEMYPDWFARGSRET
jgi:hypothetical protein